MGGIGAWQIIIIAIVVVLLFGRGKISELMGDVAKGIKSFKKGMAEDETAAAKTIDHSESTVANPVNEETKAGS